MVGSAPANTAGPAGHERTQRRLHMGERRLGSPMWRVPRQAEVSDRACAGLCKKGEASVGY